MGAELQLFPAVGLGSAGRLVYSLSAAAGSALPALIKLIYITFDDSQKHSYKAYLLDLEEMMACSEFFPPCGSSF